MGFGGKGGDSVFSQERGMGMGGGSGGSGDVSAPGLLQLISEGMNGTTIWVSKTPTDVYPDALISFTYFLMSFRLAPGGVRVHGRVRSLALSALLQEMPRNICQKQVWKEAGPPFLTWKYGSSENLC